MVRNIGLYGSLSVILVGLVVPPFARAAEIIQVPETELSLPGDDELDANLQSAQFFGQDLPFFRWFWQGNSPESRRPQRQGAPRHRLANPSGSAGVPTTRSHRGARGYQRHIAGLLTKPYSGALAKGPVLITVSLSKQSLSVYDAGVRVAQSQISSGVAAHPTPMGIFTILERQSWHTSNIYSGAPMPLMQRLTWSGIALHAGVVPGHPASHGCIRLPEAFALRLWHTARVGARVIVSRDEAELAPISHPLLPQPTVPLPQAAPARPDSEPPPSSAPVASVFLPPPGDEADAERDYLMTTADETDDPQVEASSQSDAASFQYAIALSSDELTALSGPPNADLLQVASRKRLSRRAAPEASYAEIYGPKPNSVSVFISRRDARVYARQGFQPLFDMPVTIADPEAPLGTHVFTAVSEAENGTKLSWMVVSPNKTQRGVDARSSLDRVQLPPEAVERIEGLVGVGASIIVSDAGLGLTASQRDADFTVVLH